MAPQFSEQVKVRHIEFFKTLISSICRPIPDESVTEWACRSLRFDEPGNRGPFSITGRECIRKPLDSFKDRSKHFTTLVAGTQVGKTALIMAGVAWTIRNNPLRALWVHPDRDAARIFSSTRLIPMLLASPAFAGMIPTGSERHKFATLLMHLCGSILGLVGSHSPSKLAGTPAGMVVKDEMEKFSKGAKGEAPASKLADSRTKNTVQPKHIQTSTPVDESGDIWTSLLEGDCQRRFLPCPHCHMEVVLAWLREFEVLPIIPQLAFVEWDKEAAIGKDEWDWARVEASARYVCPWCKGRILDADKPAMDAAGRWVATKTCPADRESYHLPSMYSISTQTRVGKMAVRFLKDLSSPTGVQNFVNDYLAAPWRNQGIARERTEIIIVPDSPLGDGAERILTADCQMLAPYRWWVAMEWAASGNSRLLEIGTCDTDIELREVQQRLNVADNRVALDASWEQSTVIASCLQYGSLVRALVNVGGRNVVAKLPFWRGWIPVKGFDTEKRRRWKDPKTGLFLPWHEEPVEFNRGVQRVAVMLLEMNGDEMKDVLNRLRNPTKSKVKTRMEFSANICTELFWSHMDAEQQVIDKSMRRVHWENVFKRPQHWFDAMVMQICLAFRIGKLRYTQDYAPPEVKKPEAKVYELQNV